MDREEFILYLKETFEFDQIIYMLIRYGICEEEDILDLLAEDYLSELQEYIT